MFARIARFEGGSDIDTDIREMSGDIEALERGETGGYMPEELQYLVRKVEVLADRQNGRSAVIIYFDSESDLREGDRILDGMSPKSSGWGRRVSADTYEVIVAGERNLQSAAQLDPSTTASRRLKETTVEGINGGMVRSLDEADEHLNKGGVEIDIVYLVS